MINSATAAALAPKSDLFLQMHQLMSVL